MGSHSIETCSKETIGELMDFLKSAWSKGHILANNKSFVDYAFFAAEKNSYNILFARNTATKEIEGFIAYVNTGFFDKSIEEDFVWITNWLVKEGTAGSLGLLLYMSLVKSINCKYYGTVGQNKTAEQLYERMKYKIGVLSQYFIVNKSIETTKIISSYKNKIEAFGSSERFYPRPNLSKMSNTSFPQKTEEYIINKYLKNPYYEYKLWGNEGCAFVIKSLSYRTSSCLRIVEFFGDSSFLKNKKAEFQNLLLEHNAEYIDFYCYGMEEDILESCGFEKNTGQNGLVVPNYFEPFLEANVSMSFAYNKDMENLRVFKGDCDREHPRSL